MKLSLTSFFLFCCLLFVCLSARSQNNQTATFIKIWGFLKYYHPTVAKGELDWDEQFRSGLKTVQHLQSKKELNGFYLQWIKKLGEVEKCGKCQNAEPGTEKFNLDMNWLRDSTSFDNELIQKLTYIQQNRNQKANHYVGRAPAWNPEFKNEKVYTDSIFPSAELRLLTLSRYWNMINYFFPYRYQISQPWNEVLEEMVPKFQYAKDTVSYHLAILELTAKIDDSHAKFASKYTNTYFGDRWVSFKFEIIDNKAVVTGFYNDSLSKASDIRIGDAFLSINGTPISKLITANLKYTGASNPSVKLRDMHRILFHSNATSIETEFERNDTVLKKTLPTFAFSKLKYNWGQDTSKDTISILDGNIGYVNMGNLLPKQVTTLIEKLKDTKAIIFDVRNYPKGTLYAVADFLNSERRPFVKAIQPNPFHPGTFTHSTAIYAGKKNPKHYKGKIILLCNENTQSHAEFTLMALQTAENVTTIGSQTAGADGNVSLITLPGGFKTYMTGLGIFYPDGRETQRIGIVPDIVLSPTLKGIRAGVDEVLKKALKVIEDKL